VQTATQKDMTSCEYAGIGHVPVMLKETLDLLRCRPGGVYIDGTVGLAGHARAILERIQPGGRLIGIDRDGEALEKAAVRLQDFRESVRLIHDNYKNLPQILNDPEIGPVDGILLDLGVSSFQLLTPERGFSFQSDDLLDMRMDRRQSLTAADIVNRLPERELADVLYLFGGERFSRRIAAAIVNERERAPITRCSQLADIIGKIIHVRGHQRIHPATRSFLALRVATNEELEGLEELLEAAFSFLKTGGRLVVIAFHSLEDRIVKRTFRRLAGQCVCDVRPELCRCPRKVLGTLVTSRPLTPGEEELEVNPRARSARLRALERI